MFTTKFIDKYFNVNGQGENILTRALSMLVARINRMAVQDKHFAFNYKKVNALVRKI